MSDNNVVDFLEIEPYVSEKHSHLVSAWLDVRKLSPNIIENPPTIGMIALVNNRPVAVGFIRLAEGGLGIFDGLCTNPDCGPMLRNNCLNKLVEALIKEAKNWEVATILAWSSDKNTLTRSEKFGFRKIPDSVIYLNLK